MEWEEACRVLGVPPTASEQQIHQQYLYKVQLLHPDWNLSKPLTVRERAEEELKQVTAAYNILKDSANKPISTAPKLEISLRNIRFKGVELGQRKTTSFEIRSVGGTYSKIWIDDSPAPWLKVTDIKSLTSELLPLEVTLEAAGIGEPSKNYACSLAIRLENEQTKTKDEAFVRVELWMNAEPGELEIGLKKPIKFRFVEPGTKSIGSFDLLNSGHGRLQGHLSSTRPWLSISKNSVSIAPSGRDSYFITVNTDGIRRGFADKAFINIITNGGNNRIPVKLSVARFSLRTFLNVVLGGLLIAPAPVVITLFHFPDNFWIEPLFWVATSAYLALFSSFVRRLRSGKKQRRRRAYF
jgi:hypothetical protein